MGLEGAERDAVGIILQIIATFLAALAYVWQKLAHTNHMKDSGGPSAAPATSSYLWRLGFFLMVLVSIIDVYSFSLLDQSKLGAFGAATLAWNVILSYYLLKEELTKLTLASVALISVGTVMAVSSSGSSTEFNLGEIVELSHKTQVIVWCVFNMGGIAVAAYMVERATALPPAQRPPNFNILLSILSPVTGGMCMGFTGWGAKAVSTCVFDAEWGAFAQGPIYGFILLVALALTLQVRYLNKGLEHADAMKVVPVFQAAIITSNSLGGIIFYGDLGDASGGQKAVFGLGIAVAIGGVCTLLGRGGGGDSHASHTQLKEGGEVDKSRGEGDGDEEMPASPISSSSSSSSSGSEAVPMKPVLSKQPSASNIKTEPGSPLLTAAGGLGGGEGSVGGKKAWSPWPDVLAKGDSNWGQA